MATYTLFTVEEH